MSQAGNYPDCEICHYKRAYDEEAQSLDKGNGQNTPTNKQSTPLPACITCAFPNCGMKAGYCGMYKPQ